MTFGLGDIATVLGILVTGGAIISWFLKVAVSDPLKNSMDRLSVELAEFKSNTVREHDSFIRVDNDHEHRIQVLEKSDIAQNAIIDIKVKEVK